MSRYNTSNRVCESYPYCRCSTCSLVFQLLDETPSQLRRPMTDVEIVERDRAIADFPGVLVLSPEEDDELRSNMVRVRE